MVMRLISASLLLVGIAMSADCPYDDSTFTGAGNNAKMSAEALKLIGAILPKIQPCAGKLMTGSVKKDDFCNNQTLVDSCQSGVLRNFIKTYDIGMNVSIGEAEGKSFEELLPCNKFLRMINSSLAKMDAVAAKLCPIPSEDYPCFAGTLSVSFSSDGPELVENVKTCEDGYKRYSCKLVNTTENEQSCKKTNLTCPNMASMQNANQLIGAVIQNCLNGTKTTGNECHEAMLHLYARAKNVFVKNPVEKSELRDGQAKCFHDALMLARDDVFEGLKAKSMDLLEKLLVAIVTQSTESLEGDLQTGLMLYQMLDEENTDLPGTITTADVEAQALKDMTVLEEVNVPTSAPTTASEKDVGAASSLSVSFFSVILLATATHAMI